MVGLFTDFILHFVHEVDILLVSVWVEILKLVLFIDNLTERV